MNEATVNQNQPMPPETKPVGVRFEKSPNFQSVFVLGGWGRVTGHGEIILSMFNEVPQLVNNVIYSRDKDGKWLEEPTLEFQNPSSLLVREIYVDLVMPVDAAKRIRDQLTHFISKAEEQLKKNLSLAEKKTE